MQAVKVDAARSNRSLTGGQPDGAVLLRKRRIVLANPVLLFFRRHIDMAVADAKKTRFGLPTDGAICARWWISDYRVERGDRSKRGRMLYAGSFACSCEMLELDVDAERKRVLAEIDDVIVRAMVLHNGNLMYERRAAVLQCAGIPTAVGRQYVLGLVNVEDYQDVADPADAKKLARVLKHEARAKAQVGKRGKRAKKA